ncbi:hypothetical protein [Halalkalibacter urbisdiaboli]|uniref:hypothetical protein n=1 Tax=Halalkalibacter urbisdiaboli TaxID=1960589 RepID=UPI000B42E0B1|nr:hypothetical protein [Halalkalibacter urbisdiaboli]
MEVRQTIIGVFIFALVTFLIYLLCFAGLGFEEGTSVILAIIAGITVEIVYRRRGRKDKG